MTRRVIWLYKSDYRHAFPDPSWKGEAFSLCGEVVKPYLDLIPDAPECPACLEVIGPMPGQGVLEVALFEQKRKEGHAP